MALLAAMVVAMGAIGAGRVARLAEWRTTDVVTGARPGAAAPAESVLRALWLFPQVPLARLQSAALAEARGGRPGPICDAYERITGREAWAELD